METNTTFVRQWDGLDHRRFIEWAVKTYHQNHTLRYSRYSPDNEHLARRLYTVGKLQHVLDVDLKTFWSRLDPLYTTWKQGYHYRLRTTGKCRYEDHYPKDGAHYRQKVPLRITDRKEVSPEELQKREWKASVKKKRRSWQQGRKTYAKIRSNRDYRRYAKRELATGRYSNLGWRLRKDYFDPWDWD